MSGPEHHATTPRPLSYVGLAVVVVVYLAILQGGGLLAGHLFGTDGAGDLSTTRDVLVSLWLPLGLALVFTYAVVARLGWWRPVLRDDRPVQRWVSVVPIVFVVGIVLAVDYADLLDKSLIYVVALLLAGQMVGWGEEGMFRGIGVTTLRNHGLAERQVAIWSSVLFGAAHLTNVIGRGIGALPQAIIVSLAGYFFYLIRRRSGGNALGSVLHGLFDVSILTGTAILVDQQTYVGAGAAILVYVVLVIVLVARRRHIEPTRTAT